MTERPQPIVKDGEEFLPVTEGSATILFPGTNEVFYNPVQQFNRDMSIAAIRAYIAIRNEERAEDLAKRRQQKKRKAGADESEGAAGPADMDDVQDSNEPAEPSKAIPDRKFSVLEALSATGLRAIRYAKEIDGLGTIIANDIEAQAVENIRRNVLHNDLSVTKVLPNCADAAAYMYENRGTGKFDIIDLDPYGSASPFLDAAVQAVASGGLLCVTCTDLAVLAGGGQSSACWQKYGAVNVPNAPYTHEMALRILLHTLQTCAARYRRIIVPLVSCSIDFYIRIFVRVIHSPQKVKETSSKTAMVYSCSSCRTYHLQPIGKTTEKPGSAPSYGVSTGPPVGPLCDFCGSKFHVGGPFYSSPLHDKTFVQRMLELVRSPDGNKFGTKDRMLGMLTVISEELDDIPFSYSLSHLTQTLHCANVPIATLTSALLHAGYRVSLTHTQANCLKTDAPPTALWDIMRCWVKLHPIHAKRLEGTTPATKILGVEPTLRAKFDPHPLADPPSRKIRLVRFQDNPPDWGPKARANSGGAKQAKKPKTSEE